MITKAQIGDLLTVVVAMDRRTIGDADVEAWHLILSDLELADCAQAVKDHYTERRDWLMPADVHSRATKIADRRVGRLKVAELAEADERETRALTVVAEPVDREALKRQLQAGALRGGRSVPKVDRRAENTRRAEARRELDEARQRQGDAS